MLGGLTASGGEGEGIPLPIAMVFSPIGLSTAGSGDGAFDRVSWWLSPAVDPTPIELTLASLVLRRCAASFFDRFDTWLVMRPGRGRGDEGCDRVPACPEPVAAAAVAPAAAAAAAPPPPPRAGESGRPELTDPTPRWAEFDDMLPWSCDTV